MSRADLTWYILPTARAAFFELDGDYRDIELIAFAFDQNDLVWLTAQGVTMPAAAVTVYATRRPIR